MGRMAKKLKQGVRRKLLVCDRPAVQKKDPELLIGIQLNIMNLHMNNLVENEVRLQTNKRGNQNTPILTSSYS